MVKESRSINTPTCLLASLAPPPHKGIFLSTMCKGMDNLFSFVCIVRSVLFCEPSREVNDIAAYHQILFFKDGTQEIIQLITMDENTYLVSSRWPINHCFCWIYIAMILSEECMHGCHYTSLCTSVHPQVRGNNFAFIYILEIPAAYQSWLSIVGPHTKPK